MNKAIEKALDYANVKGVRKIAFVKKDKVAKEKFKIKDMANGKEEFLNENNVLKI